MLLLKKETTYVKTISHLRGRRSSDTKNMARTYHDLVTRLLIPYRDAWDRIDKVHDHSHDVVDDLDEPARDGIPRPYITPVPSLQDASDWSRSS